MEVLEAIRNRVSIRKYKSDTVPLEMVLGVLDLARLAPSWGNKQCWRFVIVDSKVEKIIIGKASGQPNISRACDEAPYVIVLCANPKDSGVKNGMEYYLYDCAAAMQNLVIAAQGYNLSTCIVGWFDEKAVRSILSIPSELRIIAYTPMGYSDEVVLTRSRKKLEDLVYHNQWGKKY